MAEKVAVGHQDFVENEAKSVKEFVAELWKMLTTLSFMADDEDAETELREMILALSQLVTDVFERAKNYASQCYELGRYICARINFITDAVLKGNVSEIKGYLLYVLQKSNKQQECLKNIENEIDTKLKPEIEKQEKLAKCTKSVATKKAVTAGAVGAGGTGLGVGLGTAGSMVLVTFVSSIGPQAPFTMPIGLSIALGTALMAVAGGTAVGAATAGSVMTYRHVQKVKRCGEIITALQEFNETLNILKKNISTIHFQLSSTMTQGINVDGRLSRPKISSIVKSFEASENGAKHIMEYCSSLRNSRNIDDFKRSHVKQD